MIYKTVTPPPPLDRFIDNLWYWEEDEKPGYAKDAIIASSRIGLMISLSEDELRWYDGAGYEQKNRLSGMALCGTQSGPFAIDSHQPRMIGIHFHPGGTWPFLAPSGNEFHNRHIGLEEIWGADARRLHQRLIQAPTPDDKLAILLDAFLKRAPRDLAIHPAVAEALACFHRAPHRATVGKTAKRVELSPRRFIRLFNEQVGLTPKLYLRIARFGRLMADLHDRSDVAWWDVVEQNGYYDQSHFIREFREFSGFSPTEWLKRRGPYVAHIPLVD